MFETYILNKNFSTANSNYNMGFPETSALWEPASMTVETDLLRQFSLAEVLINKTKTKLTEPLLLDILFENQNYIVSHDDLGLLAVGDTLDKAIREIQEEFSLLWKDYVTCPEDELTEGAKRFRVKLAGLIE